MVLIRNISDFKNDKKISFSFLVLFSIGLLSIGYLDAKAEESNVPSWIKKTAEWWGEEKISDEEFINASQYLLDEGILKIPEPESTIDAVCGIGATLDENSGDCEILDEEESNGVFQEAVPAHQNIVTSWIKVTALWWGQSKISDQDFVDALTYLAENRILETPGPQIEQVFQKLPKPIDPLEGIPTYTTSWTNIDRMEDFQIQGHRNSDNYLLRFKLISVDEREIASDGTVSISIMDEYNRILYLDAFSVKKNDYSTYEEQFTENEDLVYYWDIPTSDVNMGFGEFGTAKIVFTDRAGNSFTNEFDQIPIPRFS